MEKTTRKPVQVQFVMDVICSGSYLGFTRFERAADRYRAEGGHVDVMFRPFQLDPGAPPQGEPLVEVLLRKFGPDALRHAARAAEEARRDGLQLNYDRGVAANTFEAHRLIAIAARQGLAERMAERLFRAHFTDGLDISDPRTLALLAREVGVTPSDEGAAEVRSELDRVRELGVSGVPVVIFEGGLTLSGVQSEQTFLSALRRSDGAG